MDVIWMDARLRVRSVGWPTWDVFATQSSSTLKVYERRTISIHPPSRQSLAATILLRWCRTGGAVSCSSSCSPIDPTGRVVHPRETYGKRQKRKHTYRWLVGVYFTLARSLTHAHTNARMNAHRALHAGGTTTKTSFQHCRRLQTRSQRASTATKQRATQTETTYLA